MTDTDAYDKPDNEDVTSIVNGITGQKGRVHMHFGDLVSAEFANAKEAAEHIDNEILEGYQAFSTGPMAAQMLGNVINKQLDGQIESDQHAQAAKAYLESRLVNLSSAEQSKLLNMYACAYNRKIA